MVKITKNKAMIMVKFRREGTDCSPWLVKIREVIPSLERAVTLQGCHFSAKSVTMGV